MGFLTKCTWATGSCQWTLDDRKARGAGQRRPYRYRVSGFRFPVAPHSLAGRRAPKPRRELCGGSLVLVPCFFCGVYAAASSNVHPPNSSSFFPFPSIAALYSLALFSLSLELWRFPSRVLIAALLLLLLLLLLSADLHFSPTQVSRFFHTTFLWFFALLYQVFFVVYVMLVCFHHVRTVGVRYMHIYALKTQVCVCVLYVQYRYEFNFLVCNCIRFFDFTWGDLGFWTSLRFVCLYIF